MLRSSLRVAALAAPVFRQTARTVTRMKPDERQNGSLPKLENESDESKLEKESEIPLEENESSQPEIPEENESSDPPIPVENESSDPIVLEENMSVSATLQEAVGSRAEP